MANAEMERMGLPAMDEEKMVAEVSAAADVLRPHITNTIPVMHEAVASGKSILFEGAQGAYLDVDFGTYPFVTSSNTSSAGACTGTGVPPHKIDRIIGVCKAYTTRVGAGPFVTEDEDISNHLHSMGREFGATTGRPRRCGWADGVLLRFSAMFNGFDEMAMTNLDGYDKCPEIKICTGYDLDGEILAYPPATVDEWERCKPVYETVPGWMQDISSCRSWEEIPEQAKKFVKRMSELIGCPVTTVGVGPTANRRLPCNKPRQFSLLFPSKQFRMHGGTAFYCQLIKAEHTFQRFLRHRFSTAAAWEKLIFHPASLHEARKCLL